MRTTAGQYGRRPSGNNGPIVVVVEYYIIIIIIIIYDVHIQYGIYFVCVRRRTRAKFGLAVYLLCLKITL